MLLILVQGGCPEPHKLMGPEGLRIMTDEPIEAGP